MSTTSSRGRSPTRSPRAMNYNRSDSTKRSLSPRSEPRNRGSRSPSYNQPSDRRNGHRRPRSLARSLSPSQPTSRSLSRSLSRTRDWSRDSRSHGNRDNGRKLSSPDGSPRSSKIVVEKLTKNITESHLREIFGGFGDIQSLELPINKAFMTNRGTAYILYHDPADAEAAIAHMHEAQLDGALLNVSIVLPRRAFSQSPPPPESARNYGRHTNGRNQPFDSRARVSPYSRKSSPPRRRYGRPKAMEKHDIYRPRSLSRSRSPRRSRSLSSGPPSPPARRQSPSRRGSPPRRRRRRSPSYSSYDYSSQSDRSRSLSKTRGRDHYGSRRR